MSARRPLDRERKILTALDNLAPMTETDIVHATSIPSRVTRSLLLLLRSAGDVTSDRGRLDTRTIGEKYVLTDRGRARLTDSEVTA